VVAVSLSSDPGSGVQTDFAGGVLFNSQSNFSLTITNCVFSGNSSTSTSGGGALYLSGGGTTTANISNSTFYNNQILTATTLEARGGAIIVYNATLNLTNCTFGANWVARTGNFHGAAIRASASGATVTATNCLFYNNRSDGGAGDYSDFNAVGGATMTMVNCLAQYVNNLDTNTNSTITNSDYLSGSSLIWNDTPNRITFSAPSLLTDATPIDFGNDNSDVGAWDSKINLFNGTTDSDWSTGANWSSTAIPASDENVTLLSDSPSAIIGASTGAVCNDLSVNASTSLTINSGGTLIVSGTSTGNITYNRNLATTNWYMVSSPVAGQTIVDFYTNESPALGTGSGDAQNVAIAPYDNSGATASDRWVYYTEGQVDGVGGDDTTDTFTSGTGYSVKMQASGDIAFTGTIPVSDFTTLSLTDNSGGSGNAFNLMGNPYPSYIASDNTANATNNILSVNTSLLTEETIWIWDQSNNAGAGGYDTYNNTSGFHIAPGQAFFVSANGASSTFSITEAMQSHQGTDTFQRTENPRPEINITLSNGTEISDSNILYIDGTTTGFDNGYDSSIFGGISNPFTIYTHAVANGNGRNLGIQSLPNNNFENMIIPLGMNATSGLEITISANAINLPAGINVYLEDKNDNSFTLLDSSSNFITTLTSNQNGIGRFFIHTTSEALSIDDVNLENISIYTSNNNNLRIVGVQSGNAQVKIYNILGKQILNTAFEGNGVNDIALPNVRTGVYIIQLETENGTLNKKVIIE